LAAAITLGAFVMLLEAFRRGQSQLSTLASSIAGLYDNRLFVGNVFEFLSLEPVVLNPEEPLPMPERVESVEFKDVMFRYPQGNRDVLSHFNFRAEMGEIALIEGRNGFGKSTMVKLLLRLYDPCEGAVLLNGIDIRRFNLDELRSRVGVLFQDFVRYNCTAAENIAFGCRDKQPAAGCRQAAELAGAAEVVEQLPQGENTMLGRLFDGGCELSMGQWQRVALARAFQSDAPLVILDEPYAWLDTAARRHLTESLEELKKDKVVIVISHS
ncbi:MAG: ABC transporter ATP-binding protein, partial [Bacteroidales bacterium]|nr:ABC transporter ATP-binding protein [Bacteroidales bacterium]